MNFDIVDSYGRVFKTLRLSLTNNCNLGCVYCVSGSEEEAMNVPKDTASILSLHQILHTVKSLHHLLDLEVIRLTGGEPTLYKELVPLIHGIQSLGIPAIKMTSNGFLLKNKAADLRKAGLSHINISLDAIEPEAFFTISRRKNINKIIEGIDEAIAEGIEIKINSVVMRGINDHQIIPLLEFASNRKIQIRFLELMKMGHLHKGAFEDYFFPEEEILGLISKKYSIKKLLREHSSTANYWVSDIGVFGIVANESEPFCHDCNRLRLDSYGNIYGCLSENKGISILDTNSPETLSVRLIEALNQKQPTRFKGSEISMLAIGG